MKYLTIALIALTMTACNTFTLVKGNSQVKVGENIVVSPQNNWSKYSEDSVETWTLDGPLLQSIVFVKGLEKGDKLLPSRNENAPLLEENMTTIEIVELFESTLIQRGAKQVKISKVGPFETQTVKGFKVEYSYVTESGMNKLGIAYGSMKENKLYMAIYSGAALTYFENGKEDFLHMINTMQIL